MVDEVAARRTGEKESNLQVTIPELFNLILSDLATGRSRATSALVILTERQYNEQGGVGNHVMDTYRCNLMREQEWFDLSLAYHRFMKRQLE